METSAKDTSKHGTDGLVDGIPANWKPSRDKPVPVVRCTANARSTGEQCRRFSIMGLTVCQMHGGQLPNPREHAEAVKEAARLRLFNNLEVAVDALEDLLRPGTADAIRMRAIENVLDRGGLKHAEKLEIDVTNNGPDPAAQVRERLTRLVTPTPLAIEEEQIQEAEVIAEDDVPVEDTLF